MIVVSDAGPLIYLSSVGQLALLPALFGRVIVPWQVWDEVVGAGTGRLGSAAVAAASWIDVRTPASSSLTERLVRILDAGAPLPRTVCRPAALNLGAACRTEAQPVAHATIK